MNTTVQVIYIQPIDPDPAVLFPGICLAVLLHEAGALHRNDLKSTLESIANDLGTPLRVEVHETDGSAFTDIVTPTRPPERTAPPKRPARKQSDKPFLPDEEVSVAVVVARQRGDAGDAPRIPPALLAAHRGDVVLVGRTSGAIRVLGE